MKKNQNKILLFQLFLLFFLINFIFCFEKEFGWKQEEILIANDGQTYEYFSDSLYIKGNISLIGVSGGDVGSNYQQGKAYVFENNGTFWNQKQILIASDGQYNDYFGSGVSISNDTKFIVVGACQAPVGNNDYQGKAYVFENNGTYWNQKQILIASDGEAYDQFGWSVSISGNTFVIGAHTSNVGNNTSQGKAYVFENNGTYWNQKQILIASDGKDFDEFGTSVSISEDENFILIGSPYATFGNNTYQGKAYVFENNGTFWNEKQILIASDGEAYDAFGYSVSISGNYSLIGSPYANVGDNDDQGKAYVFENNGTFWNQKQILIANDGKVKDWFGRSVEISDYFAIIGAFQASIGTNHEEQGKAYVFQNNGTYWKQTQVLFASDGGAYDQFGWSVSISGNYSLIGSPQSKVGDNYLQGKAYIFESFPKPPAVDIVNCSSLFSSFECFWNQINSSLNDIEYQINYQTDVQNWQLIQSPILIQNVFYQVFNSSFYPNITGNVDYSIQIRACNTTSQICGESSNQINLKTRIDSVKNLTFQSYSNSIQLNWNYPNVPIINSIPKLNHYLLSYQILNSNQSTNILISNSSTSFQINNLQSLTNYLISICGCRTEECLGEDQGEISTIQIQTNQKTTSSSKSKKTEIISISIIIPIIVIIGIILTIILIKKKKQTEKNRKELDSLLGDN